MAAVAGDFGGTNIRLAVIDDGKILHLAHYETKKMKSVVTLLKEYLAAVRVHGLRPLKIRLAVAGPVKNGKVKMTNAKLALDEKKLSAALRLPVRVMNDFEALGQAFAAKENTLVIGVGTGLGMCAIVGGKVIPSEGGHSSLPIENKDELAAARAVKKTGKIEAEDVLSGKGIEKLYTHYSGKKKRSAEILESTEPAAKQAVTLFLTFLNRVCEGMATVFCATNVVLAGGVIIGHRKVFKNFAVIGVRVRVLTDEYMTLRAVVKA